MENIELKDLIHKSIQGNLSEQEAGRLHNWIQESTHNKALFTKLRDLATLKDIAGQQQRETYPLSSKQLMVKLGSAAAAIALISFFAISLWKGSNQTKQHAIHAKIDDRILLITENKDSNSADTLKLSNENAYSTIAAIFNKQKNTTIDKPETYTLIVPSGMDYKLELMDGSIVQLNAGSKLLFPSYFAKNTREVELIGEGYFEVISNKEKPFIVHTHRGQITVLGTQFNISTYPDAATDLISLVEGKVRVSNGTQQASLLPGEQAVLANTENIAITPFDAEEVLAWKNNLFLFDDKPLSTVLTELEKWYQVSFNYDAPELRSIPIYIKMKRDRNIKDILRAL